jgi:cobalamin biosynthesis Mg chelatase CobN
LSTTEDIQTVVLSGNQDNRSQYVRLSEATEATGSAVKTETASEKATESGADTGTEKMQGETVSESTMTKEETLPDAEIAHESVEQENENTVYTFLVIFVIIMCICILGFLLLFIGKRKMKNKEE